MAFNPAKYDIESWLELEERNILQKECNVFDEDGLLVEQYKTRVFTMPVGVGIPYSKGQVSTDAPAVYRFFSYDDEGNMIGSVPRIREWTQACEDAATGSLPLPGDPGGVPAGLKVAKTDYDYDEAGSVAANTTVTILTKTLAVDESIYLRHVAAGGENVGKFQVLINGTPIKTKRTWWTKFDTDFWFNTANGGILYESEETIEVRVTNDGSDVADYEASLGYVVK